MAETSPNIVAFDRSNTSRPDRPSVHHYRTDQPLRLLLVNYEFPPMGGGAANATYNTAVQLAARGHQVHVLTSRLHGQMTTEHYRGVHIYRVISKRRSLLQCGILGALTFVISAAWAQRRLCKENDFDVCHYYFGLPTGLLAIYAGWIRKIPYVVSLRGSDVPGYDDARWPLKPLHRLLRPLLRQIWSRSSAVVALSDDLRKMAQDTAPNQRIEIIGNAIDWQKFPVGERSFVKGPLRLVCVCRMVRRKGIEYLLDAMVKLQPLGFTLDLIGSGERVAEIRAEISKRDLKQAVRLLGYVSQENLATYYNDADVMILPSLAESFGQVLLEAMSCGLPVIATRVGGIPETIVDGKSGVLVPPASAHDLYEAARDLAADPQLRRRMSEYNAQIARSVYRWERIAEQYEQQYQRIVPRRRLATSVEGDGT